MVMTASCERSPPGTTAGVAGRRDSRTSSLTHVALAQVRKENISFTTILSLKVALRHSCVLLVFFVVIHVSLHVFCHQKFFIVFNFEFFVFFCFGCFESEASTETKNCAICFSIFHN